MIAEYQEFLRTKVPVAECAGFEPGVPHESLFDHQVDVAWWACQGGRRAVFASFGLGKTRTHLQVAKWVLESGRGGDVRRKFLIVCPYGVRQEFTKSEGPEMGLSPVFVANDEEVERADSDLVITNYEKIRDGKISMKWFLGLGLDEASVLRSFGSKTYQTFSRVCREVPFRFVFTATPSPNRTKELIHYADFLGVMDSGEALTRFFKRDSSQANNLTLYPHMEAKFWQWVSSWAMFYRKPSDVYPDYSDDRYILPGMKVHWHRIGVDHTEAWGQTDSWGQAQLLADEAVGLAAGAEQKRKTIASRVRKAVQIVESGNADDHWILWHDLEAEREMLEKVFPEVKSVFGKQKLEDREERILGFSAGEFRLLATKPSLAGSGCNFQRHCHKAIFLGVGYKFNDFIQAVHRIYRFLQGREVEIHIIYCESEDAIKRELQRKWGDHDRLVDRMVEVIRENHKKRDDMKLEVLEKSMGVERAEVVGSKFRMAHQDCVLELDDRDLYPDNSVGQIVTSIPFGTQYEYAPDYSDFGHNLSNDEFFDQLRFLVPNLLRVLEPGRTCCVHVKDRIRFGNVTGDGFPTLDPFSDEAARVFRECGFRLMARITIDTDVVRENNQTYRLGWSENAKDGTKMGAGVPEYVLVFRKLPSDVSNGYADTPVPKPKGEYTRAQWQLDAAGFWRSDGDRLLDPDVIGAMDPTTVLRLWKEKCKDGVYDFDKHRELTQAMEDEGKLPSSFMLFPPLARDPDVWTDIVRMRVLNSEQSRRNQEQHVCPLQLDVVERLIRRYSSEGDVILDPFAGIGTVPQLAVKMRRIGWGVELNRDYWESAVGYCQAAEEEILTPTLFDLIEGAA